ncbi:hypothetical protein KM908_22345, partial [Alkalihalobacillus clausii]|uniref:hypothetical protein n=1 Tax=Shouchella clausii TaxID=79880 RepID=UPI001C21E937
FSFLLYKKACRLSRENRDFVDRLKPPVVTGGFDYLIAPGDPVDLGDSLGLLSSAYMLYLSKES